jgi:hypothetical protein
MDGAPSEGCSTTTILAQLSIKPDAGAGAVHTITFAGVHPLSCPNLCWLSLPSFCVAFRVAASIYLLSIAAPADTRARFLELGYYQAFQQYSGRAMRESHEQLKITEAEWAAFCKDFDDTMAKFGVPDAEKNELFAIVQSTKGDIVIG